MQFVLTVFLRLSSCREMSCTSSGLALTLNELELNSRNWGQSLLPPSDIGLRVPDALSNASQLNSDQPQENTCDGKYFTFKQ